MIDSDANAPGTLDMSNSGRAEAENKLADVVASLEAREPQEPDQQIDDQQPEAEQESQDAAEADLLSELFDDDPTADAEAPDEDQPGRAMSMEELSEVQITLPDGSQMTGQDLYRGHMAQRAFTQRTQEVAEQKRQLHEFAGQMAALPELLLKQATPFMDKFKDMDVAALATLKAENPQAFAQFEHGRRELEALSSVIEEANARAKQQYDQMIQQRLNATGQAMAKKVKGWGPEYVNDTLLPGLFREYSIAPPEFFDVVNPSIAEMAMDALAYRKLKTKAAGIRNRRGPSAQDKLPARSPRRDNPTEEARKGKALRQAAMSDDRGEKMRAAEQLLQRQLSKSKVF